MEQKEIFDETAGTKKADRNRKTPNSIGVQAKA
jgi:hypothetical protein